MRTAGQLFTQLDERYGDLMQVAPHPSGIEIILDGLENEESPAIFTGLVFETLTAAVEVAGKAKKKNWMVIWTTENRNMNKLSFSTQEEAQKFSDNLPVTTESKYVLPR